ncbi:MAG: TM0106 family RecB-like putative nuclease [Deltaproteobacteria bacterium]|nr:TM0106 family RecB-like putative nuclease [Deltaproteobacteria bacterium]
MQKVNSQTLFSASDVVNFLECEHLTTLDLINLDTPLLKAEDDEETLLYQSKGIAHEAAYFDRLKQQSPSFADISGIKYDLDGAVKATRDAMYAGAEIIFQAALRDGCFIGHADFLRREHTPSELGAFSYEAVDTKLARRAKAKFLIQLCFYSELIAKVQGRDPVMMHVVLGDRREEAFRYADYSKYYESLKRRFLIRVQSDTGETYPDPCERCDTCRWRNLCEERRCQDDHLCQVANITKLQIRKLTEHGIKTLESLAVLQEDERVPTMAPETLATLRHQAALQHKKRQTGEDHFDLLPLDPKGKRGFFRLPKPDAGDIIFDMEADPLEEGGLEYLFGVYFLEHGKPRFQSFWAHTQYEERRAFEQFMDFVANRLNQYPNAHIYHYAHYEETALKRLMSLHGIREAEVDNLLRFGKLINLYKVVREGMRISEPRYSIKNVERFYMDERSGPVKDAGISIVYYERWKETGDKKLLKEIEEYNRDDLRSTYKLRQWLLTLRRDELPWANDSVNSSTASQQDIRELNEVELRLAHYRERLVDPLPENRDEWTEQDGLKELTYQLLDFHRRTEKPVWWSLFSRQEMTDEELIDDVEAIGGLVRDPKKPPQQVKRSFIYTFLFPEQETKLKTGDTCVRTDTLDKVNNVIVSEDGRCLTCSYPMNKGTLPEKMNVGPSGPISTKPLKDALFRFADHLIEGKKRYMALESIMRQEIPRIKDHPEGTAIINESLERLPQIIETVAKLDSSYVFIQGPPGSGKTYSGSRVIVELLRRGCRIGVSSNSHKAINNLLWNVEAVASQQNIQFSGVKKSTRDKAESEFHGDFIQDVFSNDDIFGGNWQLVAGTAWLFSHENMDQSLDFLFVDEAGQVALANLIAMGTSARNIVLLGDQMQLGQPIQGVHPGRSGESSLDYLLNGIATIPPERGIFLGTTWRMHPDVCQFISEAVYDGRLKPDVSNNIQCLIILKNAHPFLKPTGICYIPVEHDACSQRSQEEADIVMKLYENLLMQHYLDKKGNKHQITNENILIVAPYNMQVNLLKTLLPEGARVGTVDKFQGQEAEVVIISMATSSGDYLPRFIEFLYSKNRLNVAISRAKCLAILIANPALMSIRCTTPEQMALVNTLCWVKRYQDKNNKPEHPTTCVDNL